MFGIAVSIVGIIGGIALFVLESQFSEKELGLFVKVFGGVLLILMIPYLIMWIILKIKTSEQDITGIERIGKVYTYVSGSLEIIAMIARILFSIIVIRNGIRHYPLLLGLNIGYIIGSAMYLYFACLKFHGIRVKNNKLLGIYLGFRHALFILYMIAAFIAAFIILNGKLAIVFLIVGIVYFILDIGLIVILHSIRVDRENTSSQQQDHQVDKMKLSKLLGFSFVLSVLGIVVSIIGLFRGIYSIVLTSQIKCERDGYYEDEYDGNEIRIYEYEYDREHEVMCFLRVQHYVYGGLFIILMIIYFIMWIILKIKTNKQDIPSIEKIGKVHSYVSGSLEIIVAVAWIIFSIIDLLGPYPLLGSNIAFIVGPAIYVIFACLKIHGVRVKNNKLLRTYLGFCYTLLVLYMIAFSIRSLEIFFFSSTLIIDYYYYVPVLSLELSIISIVYFILNISLTVILHSIRVDRENTAGKENPMKNF